MERNRIVLLHSGEKDHDSELGNPVSFETEVPPKYLSSTTSRTLESQEKTFKLKPAQKENFDSSFEKSTSFEGIKNSSSIAELPKSSEILNNFVKLGVSIEEVESAVRDGVESANDDNDDVNVKDTVTGADDTVDQALYRFEYKLLSSDDDDDGKTNNNKNKKHDSNEIHETLHQVKYSVAI